MSRFEKIWTANYYRNQWKKFEDLEEKNILKEKSKCINVPEVLDPMKNLFAMAKISK